MRRLQTKTLERLGRELLAEIGLKQPHVCLDQLRDLSAPKAWLADPGRTLASEVLPAVRQSQEFRGSLPKGDCPDHRRRPLSRAVSGSIAHDKYSAVSAARPVLHRHGACQFRHVLVVPGNHDHYG
jgi:hypothetical protein